jgi:hypothetical protein
MTPETEAELRKLVKTKIAQLRANLGDTIAPDDGDLEDIFRAGAGAGWAARGKADADAVRGVGCCYECGRCHICDAFDAVRALDTSEEEK